jgi:hypothetical protein
MVLPFASPSFHRPLFAQARLQYFRSRPYWCRQENSLPHTGQIFDRTVFQFSGFGWVLFHRDRHSGEQNFRGLPLWFGTIAVPH